MNRKRKAAIVIACSISLLIVLYIILNLFLPSVEVLIDGSRAYTNDGISMYTLYCNRLLIEAKVHKNAKYNEFIRLFRFPKQIKLLSKDDSIKVNELREDLRGKESELSQDIVNVFVHRIVLVEGKRHYILLTEGTPEALEINRILNKYLKPYYPEIN